MISFLPLHREFRLLLYNIDAFILVGRERLLTFPLNCYIEKLYD